MNKYYIVLLLAISAAIHLSCSTRSNKIIISKEIYETDIKTEKPVLASRCLDSLGYGVVDWSISSSGIFCMSRGENNLFFMLDVNDSIQRTWQSGRKGHGKDEYVHPNILRCYNSCYVYDNMRSKITELNSATGEIVNKYDFKTKLLPNEPSMLKFPIWGYTAYTPRETSLFIGDIITGAVSDSITFPVGKQKMSFSNDFTWKYDGQNHIIIAFLNRKEFIICDLSEDLSQIVREVIYKSKDARISENTIYYTDLFAAEDCLYLLSQQNVDMKSGEGVTVVEQYDYEGLLKRRMQLSIVADKVINIGDRLYFTSPKNDSLYILETHDISFTSSSK